MCISLLTQRSTVPQYPENRSECIVFEQGIEIAPLSTEPPRGHACADRR